MDETQSAAATTYWCYVCNRRVEPVIELDTIKCPFCQDEFVEDMNPTISTSREHHQIPDDYFSGGGGEMGPDSDGALSLWAPVLLGMISNPRRRRRSGRRLELEYEDDDDILSSVDEVETELDRQLPSFIRECAVFGCFGWGTEAKEMPCMHKFHGGCILPWLELHSSCPVCRYQLPSDGSKIDSDQPTNNNNRDTNINNNNNINSYDNDNSSTSSSRSERNDGDSSNGDGNIVEETNGRSENRRGFSVPLPWPFSNL